MTVPQKVFTKKETTVDTMWEGKFWPFKLITHIQKKYYLQHL